MVVDIVVRVSEKGVVKLKALLDLRDNLEKVQRAGGNVDRSLARVDKRISKMGAGTKELALQFGRFKFEMLGVLFFGMSISRMFGGMLKPSFDLIGIFDDLNFILGVAFLGTTQKVSEGLLVLSLGFLDLDEDIREMIGDIILVIAAFGFMITAWAIVKLGLASLATALGTTQGAIALFGGEAILAIAAIVFFIKFMKDWEDKSSKTKGTVGLLTIGVGALATALGSPLLGPILAIIGGMILLRDTFDDVKKLYDDSTIFDPFEIRVKTLIERLKELIKLFKELKTLS